MGKWCTVTVIDANGRRHSLDLVADSSYDAAHLYMAHVATEPRCGLPKPTAQTVFEIVTEGTVHQVQGDRLKDWIEERRQDLKDPRSVLFRRRPRLE
jgi:hypothetical protein